MNLLDLLLVAIVGASVAAGFVVGFARAGIGFVAVICGILFGFWLYGIPASWVHHFIESTTVCNIVGFVLVFLAFQLAGGLLGNILSKLFKWTGLSFIDRILGGAFGLVRGVMMAVAFMTVLMAFTPNPPPNWMVGSTVLPYVIDASDLVAAVAPNAVKQAFRTSMAAIRKAWDDEVKKAKQYREKVIPSTRDEPKKKDDPKTKKQLKAIYQ